MRELSGMSYSELAVALGISVPAVKSLLVRARVGLAQAAEARDTACSTIQDELVAAHDRRVRPNATARRHMSDCAACREFRSEMRGVSRQIAGLVPAIGPIGVLAKLLGIGGGAGPPGRGGGPRRVVARRRPAVQRPPAGRSPPGACSRPGPRVMSRRSSRRRS